MAMLTYDRHANEPPIKMIVVFGDYEKGMR
jgi:hypothetical protein